MYNLHNLPPLVVKTWSVYTEKSRSTNQNKKEPQFSYLNFKFKIFYFTLTAIEISRVFASSSSIW